MAFDRRKAQSCKSRSFTGNEETRSIHLTACLSQMLTELSLITPYLTVVLTVASFWNFERHEKKKV